MIKSTDNKRKEIEDKQHRKITEFFLKKNNKIGKV